MIIDSIRMLKGVSFRPSSNTTTGCSVHDCQLHYIEGKEIVSTLIRWIIYRTQIIHLSLCILSRCLFLVIDAFAPRKEKVCVLPEILSVK